jgi:hypothetical protein
LSIAAGLTCLAVWGQPALAGTATECDRLATDPADRQKITAGASNADLFSAAAIEACAAAVAADGDNPRLLYQYGRVLVLHNKGKEGVVHLTKAARSGYLSAQLVLASGYGSGAHFKADPKKSWFWYEKAAAQGSNYGQATVGTLMIEGKGVEKNVEKGIALLEGYAKAGNSFANYSLGILYLNGTQIEKDVPRAIEHYEAARKSGLGAAFIALALIYVAGQDVEKDLEKAHAIFLEGARAGHNGVRLMLAQYYDGLVFDVADPEAEARFWLCKAGQRGDQLYLQMYDKKIVCN